MVTRNYFEKLIMRTRRTLPGLVLLILVLTSGAALVRGQGGTGKLPPPPSPGIRPPMRKMPPPPPMRNPPPARIPDLKISERQVREVTVLDLEGKITGSLLGNAIRRLPGQRRKKILLSFAKVESIDSNGREDLLKSREMIGKDGGQLKLCRLKPKVRDQLTAAKQLTTFDVYEKEEEALASFR
jgi:anti-anti-sigma factor